MIDSPNLKVPHTATCIRILDGCLTILILNGRADERLTWCPFPRRCCYAQDFRLHSINQNRTDHLNNRHLVRSATELGNLRPMRYRNAS